MLAHRLAELRIVGHAGIVERGQVELHEPSALGLGDREAAMDVNEVREAELAREPVPTAEALCREHRQMLDVLWPPCAEQRLEQRIGEHAVVEDLLGPVQCGLAARVLVERLPGRSRRYGGSPAP